MSDKDKRELFDFSTVAGTQPQEQLGITATAKFKEDFAAFAAQLGFEDHKELFRRAIYAAADDPSILSTPAVDAREDAYRATTNSRGGSRDNCRAKDGRFARNEKS